MEVFIELLSFACMLEMMEDFVVLPACFDLNNTTAIWSKLTEGHRTVDLGAKD